MVAHVLGSEQDLLGGEIVHLVGSGLTGEGKRSRGRRKIVAGEHLPFEEIVDGVSVLNLAHPPQGRPAGPELVAPNFGDLRVVGVA